MINNKSEAQEEPTQVEQRYKLHLPSITRGLMQVIDTQAGEDAKPQPFKPLAESGAVSKALQAHIQK